MLNKFSIGGALSATLLVACLAGCNNGPTYQRAGFDPQKMDRVVVLPLIDRRAKPEKGDNFKEMALAVQFFFMRELKFEHRYRAVTTSDVGDEGGYLPEKLPTLTGTPPEPKVDLDWGRKLGPTNARWVLVPTIDSAESTFLLLYGSSKAGMSVYIFDKESGELAWSDSREVTIVGLGVLDALVASANKQGDLAYAAKLILGKLPQKDGPYVLQNDMLDRVAESHP